MNRIILFFIVLSSLATSWGKESVNISIDGSSYQLEDSIRFVVSLNSDEAVKSKVVYVELLAPEGYVADRLILKADGGSAKGCFVARRSQSTGLFELRAYTRYALSEDKDNYASKVFPVYDLKNGRRTMNERKRNAGKFIDNRLARFEISPEQDLVARGRLVDLRGNVRKASAVPVVITVGDKTFQTATDANGQFTCALGDVEGASDMTIVYDRQQVESNTCIVLDRCFSPWPKAYTASEKNLAKNYDIIKEKQSPSIFFPSMKLPTNEVLNDYLDSYDNLDYFFTVYKNEDNANIAKGNLDIIFYLLGDILHFPDKGGIRFVNLRDTSIVQCLANNDYVLYDNNDKTDMEDYQAVYVSTDRSICEKLSYANFAPERLHANMFHESGESTGAYTGTFFRGRGSVPSVIIFFIPYPKDAPASQRKSYNIPYIRHVTFHGFSKM